MNRPDFTGLAAFLSVAKNRSFRQAAVDLGVSRSALSHSVRLLEEGLGLRLLHRTTRSVALTEAGTRLIGRLQPAFGEIAGAIEDLNALRDTPAGVLRISSPRPVTPLVVAPLIPAFLRAHPQMRLEVIDDDALVDIVADGFDAGIRFGERIERDMVAVPIGPRQRLAVVGSPAYAAAHGLPRHPRDLDRHDCILYRFPSGSLCRWNFEQDGTAIEVTVDGPLVLNNHEVILQAALQDVGLALLYEDEVTPYLADGRLVRALADWTPEFAGFFLYYPSRRHVSAGLRAFIEMARRQ